MKRIYYYCIFGILPSLIFGQNESGKTYYHRGDGGVTVVERTTDRQGAGHVDVRRYDSETGYYIGENKAEIATVALVALGMAAEYVNNKRIEKQEAERVAQLEEAARFAELARQAEAARLVEEKKQAALAVEADRKAEEAERVAEAAKKAEQDAALKKLINDQEKYRQDIQKRNQPISDKHRQYTDRLLRLRE